MRFEDAFAAARAQGRGVLLPYMMAGLLAEDATVEMFDAMTGAGADGFEVGIPYSDPLMDGPVIQRAGALALLNGVTLESGLALTGRITETTGLPCAVMTYVNPVLAMGVGAFAQLVGGSGASAVIIADLPVDESGPFGEALGEAGVGLVQFAAPTTTASRLDRVVATARPFVYGIAEMGVTGEREESSSRTVELAEQVRARSDVPLVFGVGISSADAAAAACEVADGVIVGSALVRRVLESSGSTEATSAVATAVSELASSVRRRSQSA